MGGNTTTNALPHDASVALYLALTLVLLVARFLGEIAKKLNQPAVMGELLAGVFLGKTCLYYISPSFYAYLFAPDTKNASAFAGVTSICVTLYMLIAGLEMNMRNALKKKRAAVSVGFFALAVPFVLGFLFCYYFPTTFGLPQGSEVTSFALFTATAMAITALPVVAKTLRDLHLFRTDLGVVVMSAAVFDDILGWSLFAVTLAVSAGTQNSNGLSVEANIAISVIYVITVLTLGTFLVNKALPYIQGYFSYPAGELGFVCLAALASSTFALWVGLHNTLGAFIVGAAIGNSRHFRTEMRETLDIFVSFMLAPIFFGSVCINANFATDFDATVVFSILFLSCLGKLLGGFIGAKLTGSNFREACAVAACMNARGAMELILAQVALDSGIIDGRVFVALVFMAIVTSVIPGPLLRRILNRPSTVSVSSLIPRRGFRPNHPPGTMQELIRDMAKSLGYFELADHAIERELAKGEPVWDGLAVATAVSRTVRKPLAALYILQSEITWLPGATEDSSVKFAVLLLIPEKNHTLEFDLMREVSHLFASNKFREELVSVKTMAELQALFQIEKFRQGMSGHNTNVAPVIALKETGMIAVDVNDIINASPRASPSAPDLILSPKAMTILQSNGISLADGGDGKDGGDLDGMERMVEFKRKPMRRETSMSLRQTIEEYVGAIPGDPTRRESDIQLSTGEGSGVIRRKSTMSAVPEGAILSPTRSDRTISVPTTTSEGDQPKATSSSSSSDQSNNVTEATSFIQPLPETSSFFSVLSPKRPPPDKVNTTDSEASAGLGAAITPSTPHGSRKEGDDDHDLTLT